MSIRIIKPGMMTTTQDRGRWGYQSLGVPVSGAMDEWALRAANLLCGNKDDEAAIEFTLHGAEMLVEEDSLIAFAGGGARIFIDDEEAPCNRLLHVKAYSLIRLTSYYKGYRMYLAACGGFEFREVLNSKSVYNIAGLGGLNGKALQAGDTLVYKESRKKISEKLSSILPLKDKNFICARWGLMPVSAPDYESPAVRVVTGPEWDWFTEENQKSFFQNSFMITEQSNRMGYRLQGKNLQSTSGQELLSTAVSSGTLQVTHDGNLVLLMADAQTTGGYPRIGQVANVDLPVCAQLRPGEAIRFTQIFPSDAESLYLERENELRQLRQNIRASFNL
jgi:antagonist of KipI